MKILTRDSRSIVVQMDSEDLQAAGVSLERKQGYGYQYDPVPSEEIEHRLKVTLALVPDIVTMSAGYDYHRGALLSAATTLEKMKAAASEIVGRIRAPKPKEAP